MLFKKISIITTCSIKLHFLTNAYSILYIDNTLVTKVEIESYIEWKKKFCQATQPGSGFKSKMVSTIIPNSE